MRLACVAVMFAGLTACDVALTGSGTQVLSVRNGAVIVQGPEGYCVDGRTSQSRTGLAVLASCATISDIRVVPSIDGLITVQVGEADTASVAGAEAELIALLRTDAGRALLSSRGEAADIDIANIESARGVVSVVFSDAGQPPAAGLSTMEWRAFVDIRGRLTTVSVRGLDRSPVSEAQGLRLLSRAVFSLQAANAEPDTAGSNG